MIRTVTIEDTEPLLKLAKETGLFEQSELDQLRSTLADYQAGQSDSEDIWLVDDDNGLKGLAYVAPERMTQGTWNLYLIGVHPDHQKAGRGAAILRFIEDLLSERGARILLVETMGIDAFDYVRRFYENMGFVKEAHIRDFYQEGQDKIIYWKSLA